MAAAGPSDPSRPVVLAVPGDLLAPEEPRSHYLTKVGGAPWAPAPPGAQAEAGAGASASATLPGWREPPACGACGRPLSLVLQAYAPLAAGEVGPAPGEGGGGGEGGARGRCAPCPERVLLVLGCCHPGCGTAPGAWRAFRVQRCGCAGRRHAASEGQQGQGQGQGQEAAEVAPPEPEPKPADADPFAGGFEAAGFGAAGDGFGGDGFGGDGFGFGDAGGFGAADAGFGAEGCATASGGGGEGGGAGAGCMDFSDLGAALDAVAERQRQAAAERGPGGQGGGGRARAGGGGGGGAGSGGAEAQAEVEATPSLQLPAGGPPLPEFHLLAMEEPPGSRPGARRAEEEHVRRLLEEYERREAAGRQGQPQQGGAGGQAGGPSGGPQQQPQPGAGPGRRRGGGAGGEGSDSMDEAEGEGEGEGVDDGASSSGGAGSEAWGGEEYEEDHVRGVAGAYLKFAQRLARAPEQCARYGPGCEPLWPLQRPPCAPRCPLCGSARRFELQLAPPLASVVLECADWLVGSPELHRTAPAINAAANWDFAALAAFTCAANCCGGGGGGEQAGAGQGAAGEGCPGWVVAEEHVALAREEECHVAEELQLPK
ncbi:hypothetical protein HYH03_010501 [Edaphochlamys debaryana]|uniref:Programmed cell death protein 2 C-terminal domain-containing protein n=1 Tax=Edaphochlamys debaryana TaxID=47281 RepID=A0A835XWC7_9CHLO|nr:hypothetical protein HYH03_010501 [Edaphochlamys debaryana]|eukprot:KAG2491055.1 hypothetical protein HYH03_010501 [Edaphochlamys debaryana]